MGNASLFQNKLFYESENFNLQRAILLSYPSYYTIDDPINDIDIDYANQSWQTIMSGFPTEPFLRAKKSLNFEFTSSLTWFFHIFYEKFFEICPPARIRFANVSMVAQGKLLGGVISSALEFLRQPDKLKKRLLSMVDAHNTKGVLAEQYGQMGEALLYALEHVLGYQFNDYIALAWIKIYSFLLSIIIPPVVTYDFKKNPDKYRVLCSQSSNHQPVNDSQKTSIQSVVKQTIARTFTASKSKGVASQPSDIIENNEVKEQHGNYVIATTSPNSHNVKKDKQGSLSVRSRIQKQDTQLQITKGDGSVDDAADAVEPNVKIVISRLSEVMGGGGPGQSTPHSNHLKFTKRDKNRQKLLAEFQTNKDNNVVEKMEVITYYPFTNNINTVYIDNMQISSSAQNNNITTSTTATGGIAVVNGHSGDDEDNEVDDADSSSNNILTIIQQNRKNSSGGGGGGGGGSGHFEPLLPQQTPLYFKSDAAVTSTATSAGSKSAVGFDYSEEDLTSISPTASPVHPLPPNKRINTHLQQFATRGGASGTNIYQRESLDDEVTTPHSFIQTTKSRSSNSNSDKDLSEFKVVNMAIHSKDSNGNTKKKKL